MADCSEKAMAATLRSGAAAHLGRLASALRAAPADRPGEVDRVVGTLPRPWVTGLGRSFVDAARLLARGMDLPDGASDAVGHTELVANGLGRMAWQHCFGPMEPELVPSLFATSEEYNRYVMACLSEVRFGRLVEQVGNCSSPSDIRAPRRRRPRKTTEELLHAPI